MSDIYYEPPRELFEAVINNSTWGSSKNSGPLWVMDFRVETFQKLFPEHPWIKSLKENEADLAEHGLYWLQIGCRFQHWAEELIKKFGLCNVLVLTNGFNKEERIKFYSLYSFCNLLCDILKIPRSKGAPLREISFILRDQSEQIKDDDYIWYISLSEQRKSFPDINRRSTGQMYISTGFPEYPNDEFYWLPYPFPQNLTYQDGNPPYRCNGHILNRTFSADKDIVVRQENDWEIYFSNLVYDCMELITMEYWAKKRLLQYPLMSYPVIKNGDISDKLILPVVTNPEQWHKDFFPKHYWIHKEFIPPRF